MSIDWSISPAGVWALLGTVLVLAEFAMPGVIAMFFGVAALLVALLLYIGMPLSLNAQILVFGILAIALVVLARSRVKAWFYGRSEHAEQGVEVLAPGTPVTAMSDFANGAGLVLHQGARWQAESAEPIASGQRVWIRGRRGLVLEVTAIPPSTPGQSS